MEMVPLFFHDRSLKSRMVVRGSAGHEDTGQTQERGTPVTDTESLHCSPQQIEAFSKLESNSTSCSRDASVSMALL